MPLKAYVTLERAMVGEDVDELVVEELEVDDELVVADGDEVCTFNVEANQFKTANCDGCCRASSRAFR